VVRGCVAGVADAARSTEDLTREEGRHCSEDKAVPTQGETKNEAASALAGIWQWLIVYSRSILVVCE
jgi:hypothetical protein